MSESRFEQQVLCWKTSAFPSLKKLEDWSFHLQCRYPVRQEDMGNNWKGTWDGDESQLFYPDRHDQKTRGPSQSCSSNWIDDSFHARWYQCLDLLLFKTRNCFLPFQSQAGVQKGQKEYHSFDRLPIRHQHNNALGIQNEAWLPIPYFGSKIRRKEINEIIYWKERTLQHLWIRGTFI